MNCLAAVLLLTGVNSPIRDRWVISGNSKESSIYDVLTVNSDHQFPVPASNSGIFMTQSRVDQPGTYLAAYCSYNLDIHEIYQRITEGTTSLLNTAHKGFSTDVELEDYCLDLITRLNHLQPNVPHVYVSQLRSPRKCNELVLVSLAFQRKISLHGKICLISTLAPTHSPVVMLDKPIKVKKTILNGEFFILKASEWREYALAWYQGHLHVFNRFIGLNSWYLTSKIGHEPRNGKFISELILDNNPDIVSFKAKLLALSLSSITISSTSDSRLSNDLQFTGKHALQKKGPKVIIQKLAATPAEGYLCGEIGLAEFKNELDNFVPPTNALMC